MKKAGFFAPVVLVSVFLFLFPGLNSLAQQKLPADLPITPKLQQALATGKITIRQAEDCYGILKQGDLTSPQAQDCIRKLEEIDPEMVKKYKEEKPPGTLTPAEIEAGKKILEEKKAAPAPPEAKVAQKPQPPAEVVEKKPEAPLKKEEPKGEPFQFEEDFFKKTAPSEQPALPIFGHHLFAKPPSTFAPIQNVPVSENYVVGPGDEIKVMMWGLLEASYSLVVDNNGVVTIPKIGPLTVAGLTFAELKALIKGKGESITGVNVHVTMGALRSIQVFILGEAKAPGVYTISALSTIVNALLSSGGPTELGSLRNIELKRQGKIHVILDLYDLLLKGDTTSDIRLMPGDVIFIPQVGPLVTVSGNVNRPAIYELKDSNQLLALIELAGGFTPRAYNQQIQIERAFQNRFEIVLDTSYEDLEKSRTFPVMDGDTVRVFSILPQIENAVYLYGNVRRPGRYAFEPGLRVLDILLDVESLDYDTYFDYALVKRYSRRDMKARLLPFDLGRLIHQKDQGQNIPLSPLDEIYIFHRNMFVDREYAVAEGEVRKPGRYFIDQMKIRDLIQKAGDLTDEAYLPKGELIRIDEKRNIHTIYFDVAAAAAGDAEHNLLLQDEDRVIIHSIWEEKWKESATIKGEIKKPGEYPLTEGMRLKDLIFKAGKFTRDAFMESGHLYRTDWRTKETTVHTFNVEKAFNGDPSHNLALQDLDEVIVHSAWEYKGKYTVSITGEVNKPGDYPYATNMKIRDLILIGGNVKDAAFLEKAELVRFEIIHGKKVQTSIIDFDVNMALQNDPGNNHLLKPMDMVNIKIIPDWWDEKRSVIISGEVFFPGTYQVRKDERLSDVIARAGGYSEYAYLRGAIFTRQDVKQQQKQRLQEMLSQLELEVARLTGQQAQSALSPEQIALQAQFVASQQALVSKLKSAEPTGRVVVKLAPIEELRESTSDMVLENGDSLQIPKMPGTVNVLGSVYNPTALIFDKKHPELKNYLAMTGGPTEFAEKDQMYIVRADGTVLSQKSNKEFIVSWGKEERPYSYWGKFENVELNPGDTLLVPEKIIKPDFMRNLKDITQILFQIATTAGVTAVLF